jgi:hypothetical protein
MVEKYIKISYRYHCIFYGMAAALSAIFFMLSLFFDKVDGDSLIALAPLGAVAAHAFICIFTAFTLGE